MNGLRPNEMLDVLRALEDYSIDSPAHKDLVLATVVSLNGSVYRRAGAMALFVSGSSPQGSIPATSHQGDLYRAIDEVARTRKPRLAKLEIGDDDPILGYGFCDAGRVEIFFEPVDSRLREQMQRVRKSLLNAEGVVCSVEIEGGQVGLRTLYPADHPAARECYQEASPEMVESTTVGRVRRTFLCPIHPMGKVMIFGSGPDAAYLAAKLSRLGFSVYVSDPRPHRLRNFNWDRSRAALIEGGWEEARARANPDEDTSIVAINHSYAADLETLRGALQSPAAYIGLVGTLKRAQIMLSELDGHGVRPRPGAFFAPAGLDIGAETPEETAMSIAAEILAVRNGRKSGRRRPIKPKTAPTQPKGKVPGLILAAGLGKRFAGGHKLSAIFDGKPVLRHVVENALASRLDPVIVVLGAGAEGGLKALEGIEDPRLRVVFNPFWESGKASSIEVGLREAPAASAGVVSLMGDMPMVKPWLIDRVIEEFLLSGRLTFPICQSPDGPRKGYPTAFPRHLFAEIKALSGDDDAMAAVREHWSEAVKVPLEDDRTQLDVNTTEDLDLLLSLGGELEPTEHRTP